MRFCFFSDTQFAEKKTSFPGSEKTVDKLQKTAYTLVVIKFDNQNINGWLSMKTTRIEGTGSALPVYRITNEELSKYVDTSDEWIRSRTGIGSRFIVNDKENAVTLAYEAGKNALQNAGTPLEEIELVLVATSSSGCNFPTVACQVSGLLGIQGAASMDISAACSGFIYALNTAHAYIRAGIYKKALIIGVDTISRITDWTDRSTCVLFGDGAGACIVGEAEDGILEISQHSNGEKGSVLISESSRAHTPAAEAQPERLLYMDGSEVFKFAVKTVPECVCELLEKGKKELEDVKYVILHQANKRIISSVAKRLQTEEEKFPVNVEKYGNTSAASIPLLLDELNRNGKLERGDLLLMSGFGAGLTWGGTLLHW